jgi:hypothetical protein
VGLFFCKGLEVWEAFLTVGILRIVDVVVVANQTLSGLGWYLLAEPAVGFWCGGLFLMFGG